MKKILMLSTGGTIASVESTKGLTPKVTGLQLLSHFPNLKDFCSVECRELLNIDSTHVGPDHWVMMARAVFGALPDYDGIVITHGTNTMAYSAAALSVMLPCLNKPVIFTGSQIPMGMEKSDAERNLWDAFTASVAAPSGVYVVFNGNLIHGLFASKQRSMGFDAFVSVNYPLAGKFEGEKLILIPDPVRKNEGSPEIDTRLDPKIVLYKLIPGFNPMLLDMAISVGYHGVLLEAFGSGGVPCELLSTIRLLNKEGIIVASTTQCLFDGCDFTTYDIGRNALEAGVIPVRSFGTEAAVILLMAALGQGKSSEEIAKILGASCSCINPYQPLFRL